MTTEQVKAHAERAKALMPRIYEAIRDLQGYDKIVNDKVLIESLHLELEYSAFCYAIAQLQIEGKIRHIPFGGYVTI